MTRNLAAKPAQHMNFLAHCPSTEQFVALSDPLVYIPNDYILWWYCPACRGWHVLVYEEGKPQTKNCNSWRN